MAKPGLRRRKHFSLAGGADVLSAATRMEQSRSLVKDQSQTFQATNRPDGAGSAPPETGGVSDPDQSTAPADPRAAPEPAGPTDPAVAAKTPPQTPQTAPQTGSKPTLERPKLARNDPKIPLSAPQPVPKSAASSQAQVENPDQAQVQDTPTPSTEPQDKPPAHPKPKPAAKIRVEVRLGCSKDHLAAAQDIARQIGVSESYYFRYLTGLAQKTLKSGWQDQDLRALGVAWRVPALEDRPMVTWKRTTLMLEQGVLDRLRQETGDILSVLADAELVGLWTTALIDGLIKIKSGTQIV